MGCPTSVVIGNNLKFSICTHDPDTGVLTDADVVPTYRVYEDETAGAILTGEMAKLDDANTTGFYTEIIECSIANGFENNKAYSVYIEATVDGDTGGISYDFIAYTASVGAIQAKTDSLTFTVAGQVDANIQAVNDTALTGNGSAVTPWGPA